MNIGRVSPKNNTRFNPRCYSGTEWSGGDGDGDDDDPNEVQLRNFPSRLLPAGELFSLASFRPVEAAELFVDDVFRLRVTGGSSTRKGADPGGPGPPHHLLAR